MFHLTPDTNPISFFLLQSLPLVMVGVLVFNLIQKKFQKGWGKKRFSTFYFAIVLLILLCASFLLMRFRLTDFLLIPVFLLFLLFIIIKRKAFFPYTTKCVSCGARLSLKTILLLDTDYCSTCKEKEETRS